MNREALTELFDFTTFTWQTYHNALRDLPPDAIATPVPGSGWPALRNPLFHVATAWDSWMRDRLALDDPLDAAPDTIASWSDLQPHRDRTRTWLRRIIDETSDDDLYTRTDPTWDDWRPGMQSASPTSSPTSSSTNAATTATSQPCSTPSAPRALLASNTSPTPSSNNARATNTKRSAKGNG